MIHKLLAGGAPAGPDFNKFNPLVIDQSPNANTFNSPGGVITKALDYAFPIAGMILFVMILWGGFEMLSGATSAKGKDAGKQRITAAVIGFVLLFVSYWMAKLLELIFGIKIF